MRLLIVGSDKVHAIENFYLKHITSSGVNVVFFPATSIFYDYYYNNLLNKLKFRLGASSIFKKINEEFIFLINSFKPEIIWVFKGMELFPKTLEWARKKGIKLVNYNPDNPFIFTGRGSGNSNITNSLNLYDLHFTYNLGIKKELEQKFRAKVVLLPFAFEIPPIEYEEIINQPEILKVCFLGNPDRQRVDFVKKLAGRGILIDIYGNGWKDYIDEDAALLFPPAYGLELWQVLRRYRVQLNMMRVHNENSHNMRSFEVPAIGGIMLAPDTAEHRLFFDNGKDVLLYKDIDECIEKINYIINLSTEEANRIRINARTKCTESGYSYKDRSEQVICEMKVLLNA